MRIFGVTSVVRMAALVAGAALGFGLATGCGGDTGPGAASGGSAGDAGNSATGGNSADGGSNASGGNGESGGSLGQGGAASGGTSASTGGTAGAPATEPFPVGFGSPEPFLTGLTRPVRIGFKDGSLYFTEMGLADGSMSRLARRDPAGKVQTLFAGNTVAALFLDDDEMFFVERGTHSVFRMKYTASTPTLFASTPATLNVGDVARLGETMWLTEFASDGLTSAIVTQGRAGGALQDVLPVQSRGFIFTYLAVAAGQVYISTQSTGGLFKGSANMVPTLSVPTISTSRLGTDANFAYFGSQNEGRILRQAHTGSASPELIADGQSRPFAVSVDTGGVYWSNGPDCMPGATPAGSVVAKAHAGGAPVTVAALEQCPQAITTDAEFVYWIRENPADGVGDDAIMRAKKLR